MVRKFSGIVVLVLLLLTGCVSETPSRREKVDSIKIGVLFYNQDDAFISHLFSVFEKEAKAKELETGVKITIITADGKGNQSVQNDQLDRFIEQGFDVICMNLVDRTAAATVIDKARSADIPLIFYNREPVAEDLERWEKTFYVGTTPSANGKIQGEIIVDAYKKNPEALDRNRDGKLQYVMLEGEQGHQDALLRTEYCIKTITSYGFEVEKLANDTANWQRGQASTKMTQWLKLLGDSIELVICNNDEMALGAIDVYKNTDYTMPFIVGVDGTVDALDAIESGALSGTVLNDAQGQARAMLDLCFALAGFGEIKDTVSLLEGKYVRTPCRRITAENLEQFADFRK